MPAPTPDVATALAPEGLAPGVAAIIVNYRTAELTLACLESLAAAAGEVPALCAVVVDNGSNDGSAERIRRAIDAAGWGSWASLEVLTENVGFARGVNHGYRACAATQYVVLINSDAKVEPGTLGHCFRRMEADPSIGELSCLLLEADGSVQNVARRFPSPLRMLLQSLGLQARFPRLFEWADIEDPGWDRRTTARDVDWLGGGFAFLRGDLVARIGLFDPDFFFFGEDIELSHRVKRAGYRVHYDPGAVVVHLGGASSEKQTGPDWRTRQLWIARYKVLRKCYGRFAEVAIRVVDQLVAGLRVAWCRARHGRSHARTRRASEHLALIRHLG